MQDAGDPVLAGRGRGKPGRPQAVSRTELAVRAAPGQRLFVPLLPAAASVDDLCKWGGGPGPVRYALYDDGTLVAESVRLRHGDLPAIARVAGGAQERLDWDQQVAVQHMLSRSLAAVAPQCMDAAGALSVARALAQDHDLVLAFDGVVPGRETLAAASFDPAALRCSLAGLQEGESLYVRVMLANRESTHATALAARKQADGRLRLSLINPVGWDRGGACLGGMEHPGLVVPGVFRMASLEEAAVELGALLAQGLPPCPGVGGDHEPLAAGRPLLDWFAAASAKGTGLSADFHGTGMPFRAVPQKSNDCTIECVFAFMATALPPVDYKLAKAACLDGLLHVAAQMELKAAGPEAAELRTAAWRLRERITASLGGGAVAGAAAGLVAPPTPV
ncbi:MAG TPA: hypothetical protein VFL86_10715 [Burkholderiaceae bacterium]|nr:hypothetical protein [Burkholderiaceae bacterium]